MAGAGLRKLVRGHLLDPVIGVRAGLRASGVYASERATRGDGAWDELYPRVTHQ